MSHPIPSFATRVIRGLVPVVCPGDAQALVAVDEVVAETKRSLGALPGATRNALLTGLAGYDALAVIHPAYRRRAHRLSPEAAERYFASWWGSRNPLQREFIAAVKGFICMAYYECPAVKADLGYTPEAWIDKVKRRRLSVYKPAIEAHERALLTPDPLPRNHFEVQP